MLGYRHGEPPARCGRSRPSRGRSFSSFALALRRGIRNHDWSAFGRYRTSRQRRVGGLDDAKSGEYAYVRYRRGARTPDARGLSPLANCRIGVTAMLSPQPFSSGSGLAFPVPPGAASGTAFFAVPNSCPASQSPTTGRFSVACCSKGFPVSRRNPRAAFAGYMSCFGDGLPGAAGRAVHDQVGLRFRRVPESPRLPVSPGRGAPAAGGPVAYPRRPAGGRGGRGLSPA